MPSAPEPIQKKPDPAPPAEAEWIELVREKVAGLRYGVVQLTIHDGRVIQIERTEKTRLG